MLLCLRKAGKDHTAMYWGKYNVTQSMFPPLHFYPSYCNGQCALLNRQAVEVKVKQISKISIMSTIGVCLGPKNFIIKL